MQESAVYICVLLSGQGPNRRSDHTEESDVKERWSLHSSHLQKENPELGDNNLQAFYSSQGRSNRSNPTADFAQLKVFVLKS